ncbi:MAG: S41 family peptidase [Rhodobiaceae bacterium]|nr:S41 family peptidase [Rhodobiaceae bacterium]MCC0041167.1 S41 family peptidase [Rhodobiaceae bacterium]
MMRRISLVLMGVAMGAGITLLSSQSYLSLGPANAANSETYKQLNLFGDIFERVRSGYVEETEDGKLIEGAINGMLQTLDPHSAYLTEQSYREMLESTSGEFGGLGIEVTMEDGLVKVVSPIEDTPAFRAGIQSGDLITHLDGAPVQGMTLSDAVKKMRGAVNEPIVLKILRGENKEALEITVIRDTIRMRSVRNQPEDDIGYIRISQFNAQTETELRKAIDTLRGEIADDRLKGYIIDLRNNPGGVLDQAVLVSDLFLDRGEIVSTRGREPDQVERRNARPGDYVKALPIVVLINGGSASASEIVAGALQDHRRATIVGTRSFGKASVQTLIPLAGNNGALKLTTARYFTPGGRSIQAQGIEPDIVITQDLPEELKDAETRGEASLPGHLTGDGEEKSGSSSYVPRERDKDKQLQYALSLLRGTEKHAMFPPDPDRAVKQN